MSWKPQVKTCNDEKFYGNALAFATQEEAMASAKDLMNRWLLVTDCRAVESDEVVNYRIDLETYEMIPVEKPTEIMGVPI